MERATEHLATAEDGNRTVLAHGDHGGQRVVVAVAATGGMTGTSESADVELSGPARDQPHPNPKQDAVDVEDGSTVNLAEGMAERGQVGCTTCRGGGVGSRSSNGGPGSVPGR